MRHLVLFVFLLFLLSNSQYAQTSYNVVIGDTSTYSSASPFSSNYRKTAWLIDNNRLIKYHMIKGRVDGLYFKLGGAANFGSIIMKIDTIKQALSNSLNFLSVPTRYATNAYFIQGGWNYFPFNNSFYWEGDKSIYLEMCHTHGGATNIGSYFERIINSTDIYAVNTNNQFSSVCNTSNNKQNQSHVQAIKFRVTPFENARIRDISIDPDSACSGLQDISLVIENEGLDSITQLRIQFKIDGDSSETSFQNLKIPSGKTGNIVWNDARIPTGFHELEYTILEINNNPIWPMIIDIFEFNETFLGYPVSLNDTTLCDNSSLYCVSTPLNSNISIQWSNGDTTNCITPITSGSYSVKILDEHGCLACDTSEIGVIKIDTQLIVDSNTVKAALGNDTYRWYNCDSEMLLQNQTASVYIADSSINVAVIIEERECVDTSRCVRIEVEPNSLPVSEPVFGQKVIFPNLRIYPNPTNSKLTIAFEKIQAHTTITIYNSTGQEVANKDVSNSREAKVNLLKNPGVYQFVLTSRSGQVQHVRVVKQ